MILTNHRIQHKVTWSQIQIILQNMAGLGEAVCTVVLLLKLSGEFFSSNFSFEKTEDCHA